MRLSQYRFIAIILVLLLSALVRFGLIGITPWDWDEPVYTDVASHIVDLTYPAITPEAGKSYEPYLFHPPFHFHLLHNWFRLSGQTGIEQGRIISALASMLVVALTMQVVYSISKNQSLALLAGILIALDGWFTYSSTLLKFDTSSVLLGMTGLYIHSLALKHNRVSLAIIAGLLVGAAVIYKHVAAVFLFALVINWLLLSRQKHRLHIITGAVAGSVVIAYMLAMVGIWGDVYLDNSFVQVRRSSGAQEARGLSYGTSEVIQAFAQTYWAFSGSIIALLLGGLSTAWLLFQRFFKGIKHDETLNIIISWAAASALFLLSVKLRNPHYLVLLIAPSTILFAYVMIDALQSHRKWIERGAMLLLVLITILNLTSIVIRVTRMSQGNSLETIGTFVEQHIADDVTVLSEEPICVIIDNPCYKIGNYQGWSRLLTARPQVMIIYTSTTQSPPDTEAITTLLETSEAVFSVDGWKETITVYIVDPNIYGAQLASSN